jgi:hypothetical protein
MNALRKNRNYHFGEMQRELANEISQNWDLTNVQFSMLNSQSGEETQECPVFGLRIEH